MAQCSVLLVDRDQIFAGALARLLAGEGYGTPGIAPSLDLAVARMAGERAPELVLMDPHWQDSAGPPAALRRLRAVAAESSLVVLSNSLEPADLRASLAVQAAGHLSKRMDPTALCRALRLIRLGQAVYPPGLARLPDPGTDRGETATPDAPAGELSSREIQILGCLLAGLSNKAIARRLAITESTVKMHFKNVLRKIQAANRTQAAVWALEHGIRPVA